MPTTTIYATGTKTGYISRGQNTLTNVRNGPGDQVDLAGYVIVGFERQTTGTSSYMNREGIIGFNTSTLPDSALVTAVTLRLSPFNTSIAAARTYRVFAYTPSDPPVAANYRSQAQVQALTQIGTFTQNAGNSTDHVVTITGLSVNLTGVTYVLVVDAAFEDGADPAATQNFETWFDGATGATATDPYLEITYDEPSAGQSFHLPTYDSYVQCQSASSATVEGGLGVLTLQDSTLPYLYSGVGYVSSEFHAWQSLLSFDTSSITANPLNVTLQFKAADDYGMPANKIFHVYSYDFGTADIMDFRSRTWVQSATSMGSFTIVQGQTRSTVEEVTLATSSIVKGGTTRFVIVGQDFRDGVWPAASGTTYAMADLNTVESTTTPGYPRLVITAGAPPGSGNPIGSGTFGAIGPGILYVRKDNQWLRID